MLKRIFCRHREQKFVYNLYGDQIIYWGYCRSLWKCERCNGLIPHEELRLDLDPIAKDPTKTACNCAGCNPANYPETNGWKCGMHTAKEPKA